MKILHREAIFEGTVYGTMSGTMLTESARDKSTAEDISAEGESPIFIDVCNVYFPGTSLPITSGLNNEFILYNLRDNRDFISTIAVHRLPGIPKHNLDAWADSPNPPKVSISWTFTGQETPVFTTLLCLVTDNRPTEVDDVARRLEEGQGSRGACGEDHVRDTSDRNGNTLRHRRPDDEARQGNEDRGERDIPMYEAADLGLSAASLAGNLAGVF
ncbi:hypothetical protein QBC37DRAFT_486908 [Rhypophila decipiens]|uniref:Uncharacterized protein n=1 Tax=Rhypophila decipiens TaxID=261697 RepID=A0AAN7B2C7_9PEZI|nr:hypothetical protein QBC37DRAFT_486908 [Rhypophila decipiens]